MFVLVMIILRMIILLMMIMLLMMMKKILSVETKMMLLPNQKNIYNRTSTSLFPMRIHYNMPSPIKNPNNRHYNKVIVVLVVMVILVVMVVLVVLIIDKVVIIQKFNYSNYYY